MVIRHIFVSPGHNYWHRNGIPVGNHPLLEVNEIECVAGRGLRGGRFFDYRANYRGQITCFAEEIFAELRAALPGRAQDPGVLRSNVARSGLRDLNELMGVTFSLQGVLFRGSGHRTPCEWMDQAFASGTEECAFGAQGRRSAGNDRERRQVGDRCGRISDRLTDSRSSAQVVRFHANISARGIKWWCPNNSGLSLMTHAAVRRDRRDAGGDP